MINKRLLLKFFSIMLAIPYTVLADGGKDKLDLPVDLDVQGNCLIDQGLTVQGSCSIKQACSIGQGLTVQGAIKLVKLPKGNIPPCDKLHEGILIYAEEKEDGKGEGYLYLCTHGNSSIGNKSRWVKLQDTGAQPYAK